MKTDKRVKAKILKKRHFKNKVGIFLSFLSFLIIILIIVGLLSTVVLSGYKSFLTSSITIDLKNPPFDLTQETKDLVFSPDSLIILERAASFEKLDLQSSTLIEMLHKKKILVLESEEHKKAFNLLNILKEKGLIRLKFNWYLFTNSDSQTPSKAGLKAAIIGTGYFFLILLLFAVPIGVMTGIYLSEFLSYQKKAFFKPIISNLAAIPTIIFGLIGITLFLQTLDLPRSSALVGGLVLSLIALPQIIILTEEAFNAIPSVLKESSLALGATKIQTILHHLLPASFPSILTGMVLSFSRVLGEAAPLLMIGMVSFIASAGLTPLAPSSALPVQIYLWSKNPESAFVEKTAAAIIVLIVILIMMNVITALLRPKEKRF